MFFPRASCVLVFLSAFLFAAGLHGQVAVRGTIIHTMAGPPVENGMVVIEHGKITAIGPAEQVNIPEGFRVIDAAVVTPGLIDAHCTVGVSGIYNTPHDQDQLERSEAIQPELRALDAYNPQEQLIQYVRRFGITTIHTGHAPGELISGQTFIVKTTGNTVNDALVKEPATIACTLGPWAEKGEGKSPGTRAKIVSLLRSEFIKAGEYLAKLEKAEARDEAPANNNDAADAEDDGEDNDEGDKKKKPDRNLRLETLGRVLKGELPLLITCNRAHDIAAALRLADEFKIDIILDSAAEAYLLIDEIKEANVPVIIHPTMFRAFEDTENLSFETASKLRQAGIRVALQAGYESYVPKTRIVLFEAAVAAANGLSFDEALASCTINAAKILSIDDRVGSIEVGKDGDMACFDGDPFQYTSHCTTTIINGHVVSEQPR